MTNNLSRDWHLWTKFVNGTTALKIEPKNILKIYGTVVLILSHCMGHNYKYFYSLNYDDTA